MWCLQMLGFGKWDLNLESSKAGHELTCMASVTTVLSDATRSPFHSYPSVGLRNLHWCNDRVLARNTSWGRCGEPWRGRFPSTLQPIRLPGTTAACSTGTPLMLLFCEWITAVYIVNVDITEYIIYNIVIPWYHYMILTIYIPFDPFVSFVRA